MIPRDLAAAIERDAAVTIDLEAGTWQPGKGPLVDAQESLEPRENVEVPPNVLAAMACHVGRAIVYGTSTIWIPGSQNGERVDVHLCDGTLPARREPAPVLSPMERVVRALLGTR